MGKSRKLSNEEADKMGKGDGKNGVGKGKSDVGKRGYEKKILVRAYGGVSEYRRFDESGGVQVCEEYDTYEQSEEDENGVLEFFPMEFSIVDLMEEKVYQNQLPPVLVEMGENGVGPGFMVAKSSEESSALYIFGGIPNQEYLNTKLSSKYANVPASSEGQGPGGGDFYHLGGSRLKLDFNHLRDSKGGEEIPLLEKWTRLPVPTGDSLIPMLTCIKGEVYALGYDSFGPELLEDDAKVGEPYWKVAKSLPSHLAECEVDPPIIPDPSKNRILVHLSGGLLTCPTLYAFHLNTGDWEYLESELLCDWGKKRQVATVLDGVIYFQRRKSENLIQAFDLSSKEMLKVSWTKDIIDDIKIADLVPCDFKALFPLNESSRILCLATSAPRYKHVQVLDDSPYESSIFFLKFRVERKSGSGIVNLVPLRVLSFVLKSTKDVIDFLPI